MTDVLVIGGGPAGAAAGYWLADRGHAVTIVERRIFPRSKACGDIVTPRAMRQLDEMGIRQSDAIERWHQLTGVTLVAHGRKLTVAWPHHGDQVVVARRRDLDEAVLANAAARGATVLHGHEAIEPIVERGFVRGALIRDPGGSTSAMRAAYVVVADGANSSFGRTLGTSRTRHWPFAAAIRSYWPSPHSDRQHLEMTIDLADRDGNALPAYGWVAPVGDGTLNIGVGLLSTARDFKGLNVAHLLDGFAESLAHRWQIDPTAATGVVRVARVPMGGSVQPTAGPTFLIVGDAAGVASPFTGTGLDTSYETGRLAAHVLDDALARSGPTALQRYPRLVADAYSEDYRIARIVGRAIGMPAVMRSASNVTIRSRFVAERALRTMLGSTLGSTLALPARR